MSNLKTISKLTPFGKFCTTIGNLPSSYMESLTYEEQILWFCNFLQNEVIPTVNNNAEAIEELQNLYVELKNYVDNYFENLDVQEEINNKLDEMAESGTLGTIIGNYIDNKFVRYYSNVESLINDLYITKNMKCKTLGYHFIGDQGASLYEIVEDENEQLTEDGGSIINLENGLKAKIIIENDTINPRQFGAYGNGNVDDADAIQNALNFYGNIVFPVGTFLISKPIYIKDNTTVHCNELTEIKLMDNRKCLMFRTTKEAHENIFWYGGILNGNDENQGETGGQSDTSKFDFTNAFRMCQVENLTIENVTIKATRGHGIEHWNCNNVLFKDIHIDQDYDLVHFPQGGGRRDGITGSSSNITFDNIYGFTDDDMIACLVGVNWHDGVPANAENITIKNIKALSKNGVLTHSAIRVETALGYVNSNILIDDVITNTYVQPIRIGGYEDYNGGLIDNIKIQNVKSYAGTRYDEDPQILVQQCHVTKLSVENCNIDCNQTYASGLVGVRSAGIDELNIGNCDINIPSENNHVVPCSLVRLYLYEDESVLENEVGIKRLFIDNSHINDTNNSYQRILNFYSNDNVRVDFTMNLEIFNTTVPKPLWDNAIKNTILNRSGELTSRYNIPCAYVKRNYIKKSLQQNGDKILDSDGDVLIYNSGVPSTINKKVYINSTADLTQIDLDNYTNNCLIKLNGNNNNITSIINGKRGNTISLMCASNTPTITNSSNLQMKNGQTVTLSFGQIITFMCDNDTRWFEIARNF